MSDLGLISADRLLLPADTHTYESDDGLRRSWIDHIICDSIDCIQSINVKVIHSSLSDHLPLITTMTLSRNCYTRSGTASPRVTESINWEAASPRDLQNYCTLVEQRLPRLELCLSNCTNNCGDMAHRDVIDHQHRRRYLSILAVPKVTVLSRGGTRNSVP